MKGHRSRKKPTRAEIEQENLDLRDALEQIADILEEVGIIEGDEPDMRDIDDEPDIIPGNVKIINPEPAGIVEPKE